MAIAAPDDVNFRVTTTKFTFNSRQCSIRNLLNTNTLQIINEDGNIEVKFIMNIHYYLLDNLNFQLSNGSFIYLYKNKNRKFQ